MENIDKIKCILIDFEQSEKTLNEAANEILLLFSVSGRSEQLADHQCKFYVNAAWTKLKCECGKEQQPLG